MRRTEQNRFALSLPMVGLLALSLLALPAPASAERIKELAAVAGVRENQLSGLGLVVGLNRTGDTQQSALANQAMISLMRKRGLRIDSNFRVQNVAFVEVQAKLPAFARPGNQIDVLVSSLGDAASLQNGTLLATALKGHDGNVYVVASGPISVGGYSVAGAGGNSEVKNHPTVARVPRGGMVERGVKVDLAGLSAITWQLRRADFTTAARMAMVINAELGAPLARTVDAGAVEVEVTDLYQGRAVELVARIEHLEVTPDSEARVVINSRTGTIVIGQDVRISPVAVAHGSLTVKVQVDERAVPAGAFSDAETVKQRNTRIKVKEKGGALKLVKPGVRLADLVQGLNNLGASPRDLISIMQAIKEAGALNATLEII